MVQVECQPYHLEAAGCWNKLKNCLVDIDMFGIWWTPKHKKEFVALWASLTNANNQVKQVCAGRKNSSNNPCTYEVITAPLRADDVMFMPAEQLLTDRPGGQRMPQYATLPDIG